MSYQSEVLADSPVAYYRMNEASGFPQDSSGNGNNCDTTIGAPTYSQAGAILSDPTNKAILMHSQLDTFTAPPTASLDVNDVFTCEGWVKLTALSNGLYNCFLSQADQGFFFSTDPTDHLILYKYNEGLSVASTTTITDTNYHHLVATQNAGTPKLYIDGVDRTGSVTSKTFAATTNSLHIGASAFDYYPGATLDELAVYPTALTQARVLAHYNEAFVVNAPTLLQSRSMVRRV